MQSPLAHAHGTVTALASVQAVLYRDRQGALFELFRNLTSVQGPHLRENRERWTLCSTCFCW